MFPSVPLCYEPQFKFNCPVSATETKRSFPNAQKKEVIRNKQWQNKHHIRNLRHADKELDWLQSPVTKYFFLIILFDNPLE